MDDALHALGVVVLIAGAVGGALWGYARWLLANSSEDDDV